MILAAKLPGHAHSTRNDPLQLAATSPNVASVVVSGWLRLEPRSVVIMDLERLSRRAG